MLLVHSLESSRFVLRSLTGAALTSIVLPYSHGIEVIALGAVFCAATLRALNQGYIQAHQTLHLGHLDVVKGKLRSTVRTRSR